MTQNYLRSIWKPNGFLYTRESRICYLWIACLKPIMDIVIQGDTHFPGFCDRYRFSIFMKMRNKVKVFLEMNRFEKLIGAPESF